MVDGIDIAERKSMDVVSVLSTRSGSVATRRRLENVRACIYMYVLVSRCNIVDLLAFCRFRLGTKTR